MKLVAIIPVYNEEESLLKFYDSISNVLKNVNYELLFVNDGSKDNSLNILKHIYDGDKENIKIINFSRNFGKESAIYAGLNNSNGDYTAIIDADLQQDPKYLLEMYDKLNESTDIDSVCMVQRQKKNRFFQKRFYRTINKISKTNFVDGASDFRMFRKNVLDNILKLSEKNRFSKGIFSWIGFNTEYISYEVKKRESGKSKFSFFGLLNYALDGFVGFSTSPLRIATILGFITSFIAFVYFAIVIIKTLIIGADVPGYPSIICLILFIGGIQLLSIGILGEYLGKAYLEVKNRPIYIEKERIGFDETIL